MRRWLDIVNKGEEHDRRIEIGAQPAQARERPPSSPVQPNFLVQIATASSTSRVDLPRYYIALEDTCWTAGEAEVLKRD